LKTLGKGIFYIEMKRGLSNCSIFEQLIGARNINRLGFPGLLQQHHPLTFLFITLLALNTTTREELSAVFSSLWKVNELHPTYS
jgi:hypothetical protein